MIKQVTFLKNKLIKKNPCTVVIKGEISYSFICFLFCFLHQAVNMFLF